MMSIKNNIKWALVVFVLPLFLLQPLAAQEENDEILTFYAQKANAVFDDRNPLERGVSFSLLGRTYYIIYDKNKNLVIQDSSVYRNYYSFGALDSTVNECTGCTPPEKMELTTLDYLNIFDGSFKYNFYPNDTGGSGLAIGFDTEELSDSLPVGIAVIDRDRFFLKKLHLHFYADRRAERESKSYRFIEHEGYVFPDSIWEIKAKRGIFSTEYYRLETSFSDYTIYR